MITEVQQGHHHRAIKRTARDSIFQYIVGRSIRLKILIHTKPVVDVQLSIGLRPVRDCEGRTRGNGHSRTSNSDGHTTFVVTCWEERIRYILLLLAAPTDMITEIQQGHHHRAIKRTARDSIVREAKVLPSYCFCRLLFFFQQSIIGIPNLLS